MLPQWAMHGLPRRPQNRSCICPAPYEQVGSLTSSVFARALCSLSLFAVYHFLIQLFTVTVHRNLIRPQPGRKVCLDRKSALVKSEDGCVAYGMNRANRFQGVIREKRWGAKGGSESLALPLGGHGGVRVGASSWGASTADQNEPPR